MNRQPRRVRILSIAMITLLSLVLAVLFPMSAASAASVPYTDPKASGTIGLCDAGNHPIHSGSIASSPFVWRAVGASAAPAAYSVPGRTATLYAFQPRPNVPPAEWSGQMLTSSSNYTNAAHPMAQATGGDDALNAFLTGYPTKVGGLVELRLYLGAPNKPLDQQQYDATDIQITGDTWSVLRGGDQNCTAGSATSFETSVLPGADLTAPPPVSTGHPKAASGAGASASAAAARTSASVAAASIPLTGAAPSGRLAAESTSAGAGSTTRWWWLGLAIAAIAAVAVLARRRFGVGGRHTTPDFQGNTTRRGSRDE
ncbi:hypothetical protein SAMN05444157_3514 [Frankineae bacterium MT45]|nr:hypothetical protein SAMN05444157_3514 [Frankineae bacterium MT45]